MSAALEEAYTEWLDLIGSSDVDALTKAREKYERLLQGEQPEASAAAPLPLPRVLPAPQTISSGGVESSPARTPVTQPKAAMKRSPKISKEQQSNIAGRMREELKAAGMGSTAAAKAMGLKCSTLSGALTGSGGMWDALIQKFATTFHVGEMWLRTGRGDRGPGVVICGKCEALTAAVKDNCFHCGAAIPPPPKVPPAELPHDEYDEIGTAAADKQRDAGGPVRKTVGVPHAQGCGVWNGGKCDCVTPKPPVEAAPAPDGPKADWLELLMAEVIGARNAFQAKKRELEEALATL